MSRQTRLRHQYVEFIPANLEAGVLYVSRRYNTASHACCCGCGSKVVTPLNPAKWRLTDHGQTVSLRPSVGNGGLHCRSHYWIDRGRVIWAETMSSRETAYARRRDQIDSQIYVGERLPPPDLETKGRARKGLGPFGRLLRWLRIR